MNLRSRWLLALTGLLILMLIIWRIAIYLNHRGKIDVNITLLPSDSSLKIDGLATSPGHVYLLPGKHKLIASRKDFDDDVKNIDTADVVKDQTIYMLPAANTPAAKQWLLQHPDIQRQREAAGGAEAERTRELLLKKYPIISKLPYENLDFKIDYDVDKDNQLSFTITLYAVLNRPSQYEEYKQQLKQYRSEALQYLSSNGINTSRFTIRYIPNIQ